MPSAPLRGSRREWTAGIHADRRPIVTEWVLVENPAYAGMEPRILEASCHDGTPFITIRCSECGYDFHCHESQTKTAPADAAIAARCFGCKAVLEFPPGYFAEAFQRLRDDGWIE